MAISVYKIMLATAATANRQRDTKEVAAESATGSAGVPGFTKGTRVDVTGTVTGA